MAEHGPACVRFHAAMDVLARPWTGLILTSLAGGPLGFCDLAERLGGIGDRMLSVRLKDLERRGIVERQVVSQAPFRVAYRLTSLGAGFMDVAAAIAAWGDQLLAHPVPAAELVEATPENCDAIAPQHPRG